MSVPVWATALLPLGMATLSVQVRVDVKAEKVGSGTWMGVSSILSL